MSWIRTKPALTPRPEQARGVDLIVDGAGARIFLHPGMGKTTLVLKAFQQLKAMGKVERLLVIAPLRVITTSWPSDLAKWSDFEGLTHSLIHGERKEAMDAEADVYLMNMEGLLRPEWSDKKHAATKYALQWLGAKRTMLVVDESTNFKNSQSVRFKVLKRYLHLLHYRTILTGTPQANKLEDLFAQCYITDRGTDLGEYVSHFRLSYMVPAANGFGFEAQPGAPKRVAEKIAATTLQLEYTEAVPSVTVPIIVPIPDKVMTFYRELQKEFIALIDDKLVVTPSAGTTLNKLRQVAQGAIYRDEEKTGWYELHTAKVDALENLVSELDGEPLFCLTQFKHDVERIRKRLKYDVPYIGSGTSASLGRDYVQAFSMGEIPLLLGHPQSVAHGIDGLQFGCKNVCWFGLPWSYEQYYQGNLRVVRHGSKADQVFIYQILADCSVDKAVLTAITDKKTSESQFLEVLRGFLANE